MRWVANKGEKTKMKNVKENKMSFVDKLVVFI